MNRTLARSTILPASVLSLAALTLMAPLSGCEKKPAPTSQSASRPSSTATTPPSAAQPPKAGHGDHDHDHDHDHGDGHSHGPTVQLGEQTAGGFTVKCSRDGDVVPGKDVPVDVWISGEGGKIVAVRFWVGTQDGRGSVKAKAELEKDNWHTHADIPDPLPAGSRIWVEIETENGEKTVIGFDPSAT